MSKQDFLDVTGQHFESFIAVLIKALPQVPDRYGVGNKISIGDHVYRYSFFLAREGTQEFTQLERRQQEA